VTKKEEEIAQEKAEKEKRDEILQRMIDEQIAKEEAFEEQQFSIEDKTANPMDAVINKK
jgi:cell division protein FtsW